jgi:hypothetical protein
MTAANFVDAPADPRHVTAMKKTATKKPAAKKKPARKDASQIALSVVERAIGGKLATPKKAGQ